MTRFTVIGLGGMTPLASEKKMPDTTVSHWARPRCREFADEPGRVGGEAGAGHGHGLPVAEAVVGIDGERDVGVEARLGGVGARRQPGHEQGRRHPTTRRPCRRPDPNREPEKTPRPSVIVALLHLAAGSLPKSGGPDTHGDRRRRRRPVGSARWTGARDKGRIASLNLVAVVPVHNGREQTLRCLRSLAAGTLAPGW